MTRLTARIRFGLARVDKRHDILHRPKPIRDARRHSRRHAQGLMPTNEIVEHEIERQRVAVVLDLFRERIGESGKPSHAHAHGQIVAFRIARADVLRIGIAADRLFARPNAF